jgi:NAD-dependent dihydropyrimidine dehydrogenase PreA subunit
LERFNKAGIPELEVFLMPGKIGHKFPQVDKNKCTGCGTCKSVCPANVFDLKGGKSVVSRPQDCLECGSCVANCPQEAIKLVSG